MKCAPTILTGTALGLLMASSPLFASPFPVSSSFKSHSGFISRSIVQIQAPCEEGEAPEACAQKQITPAEPQPEKAQQPTPEQQQQQPVEETVPAPAEAAPREKAPVIVEPAAPKIDTPQTDNSQAEPQKREKKQPKKQAEPAQQELPSVEPKKRQKIAPEVNPPEQSEAVPAPEQAPDAQTEPKQKPHSKHKSDKASKSSKEKIPSDSVDQPLPDEAKPELPAADQAPVPELKAPPAIEPLPAEAMPEPAPVKPLVKPKADEQARPTETAPNDGSEAPMFDSQKNVNRPARDKDAGRPHKQQPAPVDQSPPPADDKAAQEAISPEKLVPVTQEKGKRVDKAPERIGRERPKGADVLKEIGDRVIIQFNNQTLVESDDRARMRTGARDVYYEDLPRGRTREIIVRQNGSQVVTIRNRNGDVIQRSRITPDGREYVLSYVDENHYEDMRDWRDPGDDLPPMQLIIPRNDYILDSQTVKNPERYYEFLEQPPVERVQRLYSVDEVKRSSRVRDIARRIDLDTLNFEFGAASIAQSEVAKLQGVADAMERLLTKNPAETFLIEGHTDAVGTDAANLALSDRRAEAVADALTNVFGIPPENLATQGYGEQYLKVRTQAPERENRRVAIRRITPLVAPVARSN